MINLLEINKYFAPRQDPLLIDLLGINELLDQLPHLIREIMNLKRTSSQAELESVSSLQSRNLHSQERAGVPSYVIQRGIGFFSPQAAVLQTLPQRILNPLTIMRPIVQPVPRTPAAATLIQPPVVAETKQTKRKREKLTTEPSIEELETLPDQQSPENEFLRPSGVR